MYLLDEYIPLLEDNSVRYFKAENTLNSKRVYDLFYYKIVADGISFGKPKKIVKIKKKSIKIKLVNGLEFIIPHDCQVFYDNKPQKITSVNEIYYYYTLNRNKNSDFSSKFKQSRFNDSLWDLLDLHNSSKSNILLNSEHSNKSEYFIVNNISHNISPIIMLKEFCKANSSLKEIKLPLYSGVCIAMVCNFKARMGKEFVFIDTNSIKNSPDTFETKGYMKVESYEDIGEHEFIFINANTLDIVIFYKYGLFLIY